MRVLSAAFGFGLATFVLLTVARYFVSVFIWLPRYERWARASTGRCARCGYDLTGNVSGACPECGTPIPKGR